MNADTLVSVAKLLIALAILCPLVFPRLRGNLQFMDFADRWYGKPLIVIAIFVGLFVFAMFATKYGWLVGRFNTLTLTMLAWLVFTRL